MSEIAKDLVKSQLRKLIEACETLVVIKKLGLDDPEFDKLMFKLDKALDESNVISEKIDASAVESGR